MPNDKVVDPQDLVIHSGGSKCELTREGSAALARFNLQWIRKQPKPKRVSRYAAKKRRRRAA